MRDIRKNLDLNIKIDLWKSLYTGKFKIVLALALVISSQYFFAINNAREQRVVPKLDLSLITSKLIQPVLVMINPNLKSIQKEGLTVDQFIVQSQQKNADANSLFTDEMIDQQIPENLPSEQRVALKQEALRQISDSQTQLSQKNSELILLEGRKQLSQMVGRDINGDEKISDVFAGLVDKKINDFFQPKISGDSQSSFYSYIIATILFLTIWPLGSILSLLWFAIVIFVFKILVRFGLIEIKTVTVQREMIA